MISDTDASAMCVLQVVIAVKFVWSLVRCCIVCCCHDCCCNKNKCSDGTMLAFSAISCACLTALLIVWGTQCIDEDMSHGIYVPPGAGVSNEISFGVAFYCVLASAVLMFGATCVSISDCCTTEEPPAARTPPPQMTGVAMGVTCTSTATAVPTSAAYSSDETKDVV